MSPLSLVSLTSAGGTETLVNDGAGPDLAVKGLTAGSGIILTPSINDITIEMDDQICASTLKLTSFSGGGLTLASIDDNGNIFRGPDFYVDSPPFETYSGFPLIDPITPTPTTDIARVIFYDVRTDELLVGGRPIDTLNPNSDLGGIDRYSKEGVYLGKYITYAGALDAEIWSIATDGHYLWGTTRTQGSAKIQYFRYDRETTIANSPSTTISAASNGQTLPQATINVVSTATFPVSGTIEVTTSSGAQIVTYTGTTATSFTGCSGGIGTMSTGGAVSLIQTLPQATIFVESTFGFPRSGRIQIVNGTVPIYGQIVTYTGITPTSFTGCLGGAGVMSTGDRVKTMGTLYNESNLDAVFMGLAGVFTGSTFDGENIWICYAGSTDLWRINDSIPTSTTQVPLGLGGAQYVKYDGRYLWVTHNYTAQYGAITKVDPVSATVIGSYADMPPMNVTSASVTSNVATITVEITDENIGQLLWPNLAGSWDFTLSGFTGGDTVFNGSFVTSTVEFNTITFPLVTPDTTATSLGSVMITHNLISEISHDGTYIYYLSGSLFFRRLASDGSIVSYKYIGNKFTGSISGTTLTVTDVSENNRSLFVTNPFYDGVRIQASGITPNTTHAPTSVLVTAPSDGTVLPFVGGTLNTTDNSSFPASGTLIISLYLGPEDRIYDGRGYTRHVTTITYTSKPTSTTFGGCNGGTGILHTNNPVYLGGTGTGGVGTYTVNNSQTLSSTTMYQYVRPGGYRSLYDGKYFWVADSNGYVIYKIDPAENAVVNVYEFYYALLNSGGFGGITYDGENVWILQAGFDPAIGTPGYIYKFPSPGGLLKIQD
jgi:hypothetical protein